MAVLEEPIVRPAKARGEDTARSKTRNAADFEKRESITGASWKLMRQVLVGAWVLREKARWKRSLVRSGAGCQAS